MPLRISFLPERQRLTAAVRQIRRTGRAYPLFDLAHLFLSRPGLYLVKIEMAREGAREADAALWQCTQCKEVFVEEAAARAHAAEVHLGDFYDVDEVTMDPPSGHFNCVARCGLSGILLGPPNYHGYTEMVREIHANRFADMPIEAYRARIETLHDEAALEKWKEAFRTQQRWFLKGTREPENGMRRAEAEVHFFQHHVGSCVARTRRAIMPAERARRMRDQALKSEVHDAWNRESRRPFTLSLALRPAFRHMGLHFFKAGRGQTFVTAIAPNPLDPVKAVETIREVLTFLQEHPGCTRREMVEQLRPGAAADSEPVAAVLAPLRWLVERGHVIEFYDGHLAVPSHPG